MMSFLAISVALGQQTITGSVSDEDGAPLPGASIVEVGTNNGVVAEMHLIRAEANFRLGSSTGLAPLNEINAL